MTIIALRVLVVGLAAYRLARIVAVDSISEPFRTWVFWTGHADPDGTDEPPVTSRPLTWLYGLVSCAYCAGWWIALGLYAAWVNLGWSRPLIGAVAVAGVAAQLAGFDRAVNRD